MELTVNLAAGVVSSWLAVALVELYLWLRRRLEHRPLRTLLAPARSCAIVVPTFPGTHKLARAGLLGTHDAYALAYTLQACQRAGVTVGTISSASQVLEDLPPAVVSIAGMYGNDVTAAYIRRYCPGFIAHRHDDEAGRRPNSYQCGEHTFADTADDAWAFVVRLRGDLTDRTGSTLLLWGESGMGTAAAGYYLENHAARLVALGRESFFVALRVDKRLGHRAVALTPLDISDAAFRPSPS